MTAVQDSRVLALRERVVHALNPLLERLAATHSSVDFEVFDWDVKGDGGRRSDAVIGLDANLRAGSTASSPCVSVLVVLAGVDAEPELEFLGVSWSAPHPSAEVVVIREPVPLTDQAVETVVAAIPSLAEALSRALQRVGH